MIVREIIQHPELIDDFDWFNDYKDTRNFLIAVKSDLLERFDQAYYATPEGRSVGEVRNNPAGKLLARMGRDYWETESAARRVAEHAAEEIAELVVALLGAIALARIKYGNLDPDVDAELTHYTSLAIKFSPVSPPQSEITHLTP